ncbi:MAG: hypothetical protein NC203_08180 [Firmicutes bacterium]|nr:hypothetical protein [Bacillota bacterium]
MKKTACILALSLFLSSLTACQKADENSAPNSAESLGNADNTAADGLIASEEPIAFSFSSMETEHRLIKLSELRENKASEISAVTSAGYENLSLSEDFVLEIPDSDTLYQLGLSGRADLDGEEYCMRFEKLFDGLFGGLYTEEELKELIRFNPSTDRDGLVKNAYDYPSNLPLYYSYKDKIISGEIGVFEILTDTDRCYLDVFASGYVHGFSRGVSKSKYCESNFTFIGFWTPDPENYTVTPCNMEDNTPRQLIDGGVSPAEAAELTEKFLNEVFLAGGNNITATAAEVYDVDFGSGEHGYFIKTGSCYKGVPFFVPRQQVDADHNGGSGGRKFFSFDSGEAFMVKKGETDVAVGLNTFYDVKENREFDSVIPFSKAAEICSGALSSYTSFNVLRADLVYTKFYENEEEHTRFEAIPTWHLTALNQNDGMGYDIWVNAITGEYGYGY